MSTVEQITALEKQLEETKAQLLAARKQLPQVPVEDYVLKTVDGSDVRLSELFGDHDEMLLIHNMGTGCSYCTIWADGFNPFVPYFTDRCAFVVSSPDPHEKMAQFASSRGWKFPIVSIDGTTLAGDFEFKPDEMSTWPGVTALQRQPDGSITRHTRAFFGPGDDYCSVWGLLDLLPGGVGSFEPNYQK